MQTLPAHEPTIRARQKDKARRHLAWLARSPQRTCELLLRLLVHGRRDERRPDRPGADGVDANSVLDLLVGERAREGYDGALGGGVVQEVRPADVGVHGGAGDDRVAALHLWERVFGEEEKGVNVCCEGVEPLLSVKSSISRLFLIM